MFYLIKDHILFGMGGEAFSSTMIAKSKDKDKLKEKVSDELKKALGCSSVELVNKIDKEYFLSNYDCNESIEIADDELIVTYESDGFDRVEERFHIVSDEKVEEIQTNQKHNTKE